jgi:hypothetical protein
MAAAIEFFLGNFTLTFFVIGLAFSAVAIARGVPAAEALLKWFIFWSIGVSYIYNGIFHIFFGDLAARFIGWANSPFQLEVGFASLGFGVIGLIAPWRSFDMRLAAILGPSIFLWGAAGGHIYQMVAAGNFAPGNAGMIFWTDVLLPVVGFALLWFRHRKAA